MIWKLYKEWFAENKMILLGSSTKAGSPLKFFSNIQTGIQDLFRKPVQWSGDGVMSIGYGIAEGTESFFSKSIEAVFGSPGDLLGSLS